MMNKLFKDVIKDMLEEYKDNMIIKYELETSSTTHW